MINHGMEWASKFWNTSMIVLPRSWGEPQAEAEGRKSWGQGRRWWDRGGGSKGLWEMGKSLENYDLFIGAGVEPDLGSRMFRAGTWRCNSGMHSKVGCLEYVFLGWARFPKHLRTAEGLFWFALGSDSRLIRVNHRFSISGYVWHFL